MVTFTIPSGSMLYRGALTVEPNPIPRLCNETGKTGVYFALNHPFLSENMCLEYESDLNIAVYKTTAPITLEVGKYESRSSYIDFDVEPVNGFRYIEMGDYYQSRRSIEVFLTQNELTKIQYLGCYFMTYSNAFARWIGESSVNIADYQFQHPIIRTYGTEDDRTSLLRQ